jgi:hypothetical protein
MRRALLFEKNTTLMVRVPVVGGWQEVTVT